MKQKELTIKKILGAITIFVIMIMVLWQSENILSFIQSNTTSPFSGYTKVTLVASQPNDVQFGDSIYYLGYGGPSYHIITQEKSFHFSVVPQGLIGIETFSAV